MALFDRSASIILETTVERIEIGNIRISFNCEKSTDSTKNKAKVSIYNLSAATRAKFDKKDAKVTLLAGYNQSGGEEIIFIGDVVTSTHISKLPEIITELELSDGHKALRDQRINESLKEGTTLERVVDKIASATGLPIKEISGIPDEQFTQGLSLMGPVKDALDKIAEKAGLEWSIQNDELQITAKDGPTMDTAILLDVTSGLVEKPEQLVKDANKLAADDTKKLKITSLLIPKLAPGRKVQIDSITEKGLFKVDKVTHSGDTHGQVWNSEIEVREV